MKFLAYSLLFLISIWIVGADHYHQSFFGNKNEYKQYNSEKLPVSWDDDKKPEKWMDYSKIKIKDLLKRKLNGNIAKNIIFFLGDGMGLPTVTAGRILKGQKQNRNGEEEITNMESLDHLALSKTYNIDSQTPDSAGTATAYLSGVKTGIAVIGLDGTGVDCKTSLNARVESILDWAYFAGKSTGIVTTTRITHATPAGAYAHVHHRDMESYDSFNFGEKLKSEGCSDIAAQLVEENSFINVIFGGGRKMFLPKNEQDFADKNKTGQRTDKRNLIKEWENKMKDKQLKHKFLWNMTEFQALKQEDVDYAFGLFNYDHMEYELERIQNNPPTEPSLKEMSLKAIDILSKNDKGYFLLIEGGRIDHGHHDSKAQKALDDFVAFDEAIGEVLKKVSLDETIVAVTADHSHVFSIGGYSLRGNPLFNINVAKEDAVSTKNLTYTPLLYANGPGFKDPVRTTNLTNDITTNIEYMQESAVPISYETHGGEDVAIYASGPMAYLFDGTVEQSHIAHVMAYSACIGPYNSTKYADCATNRGIYTNANKNQNSFSIFNRPTYSIITLLVISNILYSVFMISAF